MAKFNSSGELEIKKFDDYLLENQTSFRKIFGDKMQFTANAPQQQICADFADKLSDFDEAIVEMMTALTFDGARGNQLERLAAPFGIVRRDEVPSRVTIQLTGVLGAVIPTGHRISDIHGNLFYSESGGTIDASNNLSIIYRGDTGVVLKPLPNTVNKIVDSIVGLETVNNSAEGTAGQSIETDIQLRNRLKNSSFTKTVGTRDSILSRIYELQGVSHASVYSNDTSAAATINGVSIAANSIYAVVQGGQVAEIGEAIAQTKPPGIPTANVLSAPYAQTYAVSWSTVPIKFDRPKEKELLIRISFRVLGNIEPNYQDKIRNNIAAYFTNMRDLPLNLQLEEITIGGIVYMYNVNNVINITKGFGIISSSIEAKTSGTPAVKYQLNANEIAVLADKNSDIVFTETT